MANKQKSSGNTHTRNTSLYLKELIQEHPLAQHHNDPDLMVAKFLYMNFPNLKDVKSKFDFSRPDHHPDLYLYLENKTVPVHLFSIKKNGKIQLKNPGAKSFLHKYFALPEAQEQLNSLISQEQRFLYEHILLQNRFPHLYLSDAELKKVVRGLTLEENDIKQYRLMFLERIRDHCYSILLEAMNHNQTSIFEGFKQLSMIEEYKVVLTQDKMDVADIVLQQTSLDTFKTINILKKNNSSIHLTIDDFDLELRFKFESSLFSSIKLATKLVENEHSPKDLQKQRMRSNSFWLDSFENLIATHASRPKKNSSNAIGRCNETLLIYQFVKHRPSIDIVDADLVKETFDKYFHDVSPNTLSELFICSSTTYFTILEFLDQHFNTHYDIQQIQLVAGNYIFNNLETADIVITVLHSDNYVEIPFSLKALKKKNTMMTLKNPGIGSILSYSYFDIYDDMQLFIARIKEDYSAGRMTRKEVLTIVSSQVTAHLMNANQHSLELGLKNMIGTNTSVISFYQQNTCSIHSHIQVNGQIRVEQKTPTTTRLSWDDNQEEIRLRVKFSEGATHGWSSLKLACERPIF